MATEVLRQEKSTRATSHLFSFSEPAVWCGQEVLQEVEAGREPLWGWGSLVRVSRWQWGKSRVRVKATFPRASSCGTMLETDGTLFQVL